MNLLHLESSGSWGGQEYRTCLEINWLNANGHRAWLICDPTSEVMTKARELGTPVVPMSLKHRINPLVSFRIWLFCRRNRVDLIKTYSSKDHWLCLPLYLCGWPVTRSRCITDPLGHKKRAFIYRHGCAKIVADAQVIKKEFIEQYGITGKKIEVIGSAVDLEKFSPNRDRMKFRREVGLSEETPIIVNIGMIRPDKGQFNLVEAARIVRHQRPDAHFVFVGEATGGRSREKWVRKAIDRAGLNGNVLMMGYRWDIPDILAAANMVVIASRHTEASPIVLREAFASGRPVVATRVGDVPEIIVHGENGLIVQPNDSNALATAILLFLSDENLAARCAANGLRYAREHFCFDRMMRAKLDVDVALVEASKKRRVRPTESSETPELPPIASPVTRLTTR
ncbi:MAG TPA: glycosyltransferase family 4 protein [Chthoniobacterales bacterium]|nr:glycosyltransferase family 4 protein [Chthoniobacterales bacterium]